MTQLKVDTITDAAGTAAPDLEDGLTVNGAALSTVNTAEYYSSATEPSSPKDGAIWWDTANDKVKIYVNDEFKQVTLGTEAAATWTVNLSDFTFNTTTYPDYSVSGQETNPSGMVWNSDGTSFYICGRGQDSIHQYDCTTAYDLSTASFANKEISISSQATEGWGIDASADGTNFYVACGATHKVYQYTATTAWDISTASYSNKSYNFSTQDYFGRDVKFNTDGTKMFVLMLYDEIFEYDLSTAWDVSTASYSNSSLATGTQDSYTINFTFNPDGTQLITTGTTSDTLYQYSLTTGFDLSTASYDSVSYSVSSHDTNPRAVTFNSDGTKAFVIGDGGNNIRTYETGL